MGGSLAELIYNQLSTNAPVLFSPNLQALGLIGLGILERISSTLIHVAWGYLCFMAALHHKRKLFLIALPMGLIDFLVPFAQSDVILFEVAVFGLAALSVLVSWYATRHLRKGTPEDSNRPAQIIQE